MRDLDRYGHQVAGANLGLAVALAAGMNPIQGGIFAGVTAAFSGGRLSPDVDQWQPFRDTAGALGRRLPARWALYGNPLAHRRLTHWFGLPVGAGVLVAAVHLAVPGAGYVTWLAWAVCLGWLGHDMQDWWFGLGHAPKAADVEREAALAGVSARSAAKMTRGAWVGRGGERRVTVRGAGVPLAPWWLYSGFGWFHSGGRVNHVVTWTGHFTVLVWAWLLLTGGPS